MRALTSRSSSGNAALPAYGREPDVRHNAWSALGTRIATFFRKFVDQRRDQRRCGDLESMSDRDLRDIGLRRTDIEFALHGKGPSLDLARFDRSLRW
jgi:uncharacterized protein YjiS (DUF1127 family)